MFKKLNEEVAGGAIGAASIAAVPMPLLQSMQQRKTPKYKVVKLKFKQPAVKSLFHTVFEAAPQEFDRAQVINRLKALEAKNISQHQDVTQFGLVDADGQVVRVSVKSDQAEEFEQHLRQVLADVEKDGETPDVAELLFSFRNQYDITDVIFPNVEEDEEEDQPLDIDSEAVDEPEEMEPPSDALPTDEVGTEDVKSVLQQVIDMMKADADARRAEAVARQREAEAAAQEAQAKSLSSAVAREEELLDMEAKLQREKEASREVDRLAKLSQWKKETASNQMTDNDKVDYGLDKSKDVPTDVPDDLTNDIKSVAAEENEEAQKISAPTKTQTVKNASSLLAKIKARRI